MSSSFSFRCPFCGNVIRVVSSSRSNASLQTSIVRGAVSVGFSVGVGGTHVISGYRVHCRFCHRKYRYYDMNNDFTFVFSISQFSESVIKWLKYYGVPLDKLPSLTVAVVEPLDESPYKRLLRNVKRVFGRQKFSFVEIIFRFRRGGKEYRGVLVGRLFREESGSMTLKISNNYWINEPPVGEQL